MRVTAIILLLLAAACFGASVWLRFAPMEEPATLGRTPIPSKAPWKFDPEEAAREARIRALIHYGTRYGLPAAGVIFLIAGVALLGAETKAREGL